MDQINAAGGVNGRKIELIVRDTQSDPTKAVNATAGDDAAAEGARHLGTAQLRRVAGGHPVHGALRGAATSSVLGGRLIDVKKYPIAFRKAPSNQQSDDAGATTA